MDYKNFLTYIQDGIRNNWNREAMTDIGGETITYAILAERIEKIHILFEHAGIRPQDKVTIYAKNCVNWGVAFLGASSYEATVVPLLSDFTPESASQLIDHSESIILFTDTAHFRKMDISRMPNLKAVFDLKDFCLLFNAIGDSLTQAVENIDSLFLEKFFAFGPKDINYPSDNFDKIALINYTSGTSSDPKGVMLSYRNVSSNMEFGHNSVVNTSSDSIVSMLPLAHMYGMIWEFLYQLHGGSHIYFLGKVPSPKVLLNSFAKIRPYMMITVPLVVEKIFKNSIFPVVKKPYMKALLNIPIIAHIIKKRIRAKLMDAFGGNLQYMFIGGAAITKEVEDWMKALKMPYSVGYGMTECAPLIGYSDWRTYRKGSCGRVVDRLEIRVDSEDPEHIVGELQVRGDNVMVGYFKNDEATKASFTEDGWMKTGDLGLIDENGNIFIKGRSKNMILSANGQNIYPEEIEDKLNNQPYIVESVVVERDKKIVALVYPDYDRVSQESLDDNALAELMDRNRINLNLLLPMYSQIAKIELRKEEFEKTPKRSIKRFKYR
ncbi:MAG: AMP-binding protein [Bacteroidales bacterium]|nr:AMP-binding protein [Candidatus Cacconaster equifaecalis]